MIRLRAAIAAALLIAGVGPALSQSAPGWVAGFVPTPAQWNAAFASKQDALGGPLAGPIITSPSTAARAGFSIAPGVAPTSPNVGDMWVTSGGGLFAWFDGAAVPLTPRVINRPTNEASYTIQPSDCGNRLVGRNSTAAMSWTLPQNAGAFAKCSGLTITNQGVQPLFVNAQVSLFNPYVAAAGPNGFSQVPVSQNQTVTITSDRNGAWIADILPSSKSNGYEKSVYVTSYSLSNGGPFFQISGTPTIGNTIGFDYTYETTPGGPGSNTLSFRYTFLTNTVAELETAAQSLVAQLKNNATLVGLVGPDNAQYFVAVQTAPLPTPTWLVAMNQVWPFNPSNHPHATLVNTPGGHTVTIIQTNDIGGGAVVSNLDIGSWFGCTRGTIYAGRQPQAGDRICGFFVGGEVTGYPINNHDYQPIYGAITWTITDPTPGLAKASMDISAAAINLQVGNPVLGLGGVTISGGLLNVNANFTGVGGVLVPNGTVLALEGPDGGPGAFVNARGFGGPGAMVMQATRGTGGTPAAVTSGDLLGAVSYGGYNGAVAYTQSASINCVATETYTAAHSGSYCGLFTTTTGTNSLTERGRVENDGGLTWPPTVTGGSQGAGTINVSGNYYVNGVAISATACAICAVTNTTNTFTAAQVVSKNATTPAAQSDSTLQLVQNNATINRLELDSYAAPSILTGVRANGTAASPTTLAADDQILSLNAWGFDGTSRSGPAGAFRIYAGGTWSNTSHPTYLDFATTPASSTTLTTRGRISSGGQWLVGGNAAPNSNYLIDLNNNAASTSSGLTPIANGTLARFVAADGVSTGIEMVTAGGSSGSIGNAFRGLYAGGTLTSPTVATGVGNVMHSLTGYAHDGTGFQIGGAFQLLTTQSWSVSARGSKFFFYATPDGSTTLTLAATIQNGLAVGSAAVDPGNGIVNATTGYRVANAALACAHLAVACITGNQTITLGGDLSGSGTTSITATLNNVASAGTTGSATAIPVVTINAKGLVTSISTATPTVTSVNGVSYPASYTSGGVPYASGTGAISSSGVMTANAFVTGGGAGASPNAVVITGLVKGNGASAPAAYAGTSCTNQFPRSLDLNGAATCASVANADLTNSSLTVNGTAISLGGSGTVTAAAGTLTGATLNATVTASSLTSLGTITSLTATTINAFTLGGTVSGGGNQLNNVVIGSSTPLAGSFTTVLGSTSVTSPIHAGGSAAGSSLTLESTSGAGTTDSIVFKSASQTTRGTLATGGQWLHGGAAAPNVNYVFDINNNAASTASGIGISLARFVAADGVSTVVEMTTVGGSAGSIGSAFRGVYAGGTLASPTVSTGVGNVLLNFLGYAHDGTGFQIGGAWQVLTTQTWSGSARGTKQVWYVNPDSTTSLTLAMTLQSSGGLSIGSTTDPAAGGLQVNGNIFAPNLPTTTAALGAALCWTATTGQFQRDTNAGGCLVSIREAKNFNSYLSPAESLDKVMALKPISFNFKPGYGDGGKFEQFGFYADEVARVDERLASRGEDGKLAGVRYLEMPAILAGAIQRLKADNDDLREEVRELRQNRR